MNSIKAGQGYFCWHSSTTLNTFLMKAWNCRSSPYPAAYE